MAKARDPILTGNELPMPKDGYGRTIVLKATKETDTYVVLNADGSSRFALSWPAGAKDPAEAYGEIHKHLNTEWQDSKGDWPAKYQTPAIVDVAAAGAVVTGKVGK